jgi:hypothetical protein
MSIRFHNDIFGEIYMKKSFLLLITFGLIGLMTVDCSKLIVNSNNINNLAKNNDYPIASASYNGDFILSYPKAYYSYEARVLTLKIEVNSLSNSIPTNVIACMNGTNYTMGID